MSYRHIDEILQWTGTVCLLAMYTLMSYFPEYHPWQIVAGMCGSACYLLWSHRVANKPQMLVNVVSIAVCFGGLYKAWG